MKRQLYIPLCVALLWASGCIGEADFPYADPNQEEPQEDAGDQGQVDMPDGGEPDGEEPDGGDPDVTGEDMPDGPDGGEPDGDEPDMPDEPDAPEVDPALDAQVMVDTIMPTLTSQTCTDGFCHGPNTTTNPFKLYPMPDGEDQINANLERFVAEVNFQAPGDSVLLARATDSHQGATINAEQYCVIFDWIDAADGNADQECSPP